MSNQTSDQYWRQKKRALVGYEGGVGAYDRLYGEEQDKKYKRCSQYLDGASGKAVLDCGCGTGKLLAQLSRQGGFFVGVDYSWAMLRLAQKRAGLADNVDLICADADNLPFRSASFDRVMSFTMLGNMPNMGRTLLEFGRVVRDSGQVVLSFSKKNIKADEVLRCIENASVRLTEFIDDEDLKDWVAVGEKRPEAMLKGLNILASLKSLL